MDDLFDFLSNYLFIIVCLVVGFLQWIGKKVQSSRVDQEFEEGEQRRQFEWEEDDEEIERQLREEQRQIEFPPIPSGNMPSQKTVVQRKPVVLPPAPPKKPKAPSLSKEEQKALEEIRRTGDYGSQSTAQKKTAHSEEVIDGALKLVRGPYALKQAMIIKEILDEPKGLKW